MGLSKAILIQPPFLQLNSPYPAIAYLSSFLSSAGIAHAVRDLAIDTARAMFSRSGLERIFSDARDAWPSERLARLEAKERSQLLRYFSNATAYAECADSLIGILSGSLPDAGLAFLQPETMPWGERASAYLDSLEGPADPLRAAGLTLEDIADFISFTLDPGFSLARYAEMKASSQPSFAAVEAGLRSSYVLEAFVRPLARAALGECAASLGVDPGSILACVSVPFPGTLLPALAILEEAKALGMSTAMGGGYVSTELRCISAPGFFTIVDYLCFDSGYLALASIMSGADDPRARFFRTMRRDGPEGPLRVEGFPPASAPDYADGRRWLFLPHPEEEAMVHRENSLISSILPDYGYVRPGAYLRIRESSNSMQALWSSGTWLKARLAYGCYWGRCSFCDCSLDYIRNFRRTDPRALQRGLAAQAARLGLNGIHLADEAAPLPDLLRFALENARTGRPLRFWGNGRFEPGLDAERAEFLAWAGLLAYSAGIEDAAPDGPTAAGKGISLADIVAACSALARAGILVHAYLIHGLPGRGPAEALDSLEALRQMFTAGILHSAFFHRFVLTRHSPLYGQIASLPAGGDFGLNDLIPAAAPGYDAEAVQEGLDRAMAAYMEGEGLDRDPRSWFRIKMPAVRLPATFIASIIDRTAAIEPGKPSQPPRRAVFIGGSLERDGMGLAWSYRNELRRIGRGRRPLPVGFAEGLRELLASARPSEEDLPSAPSFEEAYFSLPGIDPDEARGYLRLLRSGGLLRI